MRAFKRSQKEVKKREIYNLAQLETEDDDEDWHRERSLFLVWFDQWTKGGPRKQINTKQGVVP